MQDRSIHILLERVARRQRLIAIVAKVTTCWWVVSCIYLTFFLSSRLLGVIPAWFTVGSLALVPLLSVLAALILCRRPTLVDAARAVDAGSAAKDLFLTAAVVAQSMGAYQALVLAEAQRRAASIKPAAVLPWVWRRDVPWALVSFGLLCLAVFTVPQLDPFGRQQERKRVLSQQTRLRETIKATALRAELLAQSVAGQSNQVAQAVEYLQKVFNMAKPEDKAGTFNRLNDAQKTLADLWRKASDEKLRDALNRAASLQSFGLNDTDKAQQLRQDLEKGDLRSTVKELNELKALAQKLAEATDAVSREAQRQTLANRLQSLREMLAQQANSGTLDAALQRAIEQLQMASQDGMALEALKGMAASMDLTADELKQMAASMQDLRRLEDALKAIQSAKRLNGVKPLDGQVCRNCQSPGEYAALFNSLYADCSGGPGVVRVPGGMPGSAPGMGMEGGPGVGPRPHGDDSAASEFVPQQAPSEFQPGQVLLSWKSREVSDPGRAREDFRQAVQAVRQAASEAVIEERIPAVYHTTIKAYFESLSHESK